MIVYLLRHGVAEDARPGCTDAQRALTDDGVARLEHASRSWRRLLGQVDRILVSPLERARQTAAIFARAVARQATMTETEALLPGAPPLRTQELLQAELLAGATGVACVGHEPQLGGLLALLLTGSERGAIPLKKGMLVGIDVAAPARMHGQLLFALSQRLAALVAE